MRPCGRPLATVHRRIHVPFLQNAGSETTGLNGGVDTTCDLVLKIASGVRYTPRNVDQHCYFLTHDSLYERKNQAGYLQQNVTATSRFSLD